MAATLAHRGPDGHDVWADAAAGIGLGHRRLAIVDLSPTGAQPMHSADGRFVIIYNGEVYNFPELRQQLIAKGHAFRGTSDTEVMLAAFTEWGVQAATSKFIGMFAFAVFDRRDRTLYLVRDRLGVKPLYYSTIDRTLVFGSELRALMTYPGFKRDVDRDAVASLVRYSYIPAPATIFRNVQKLPPGSILTAKAGGDIRITTYWDLASVIRPREPVRATFEEASEAIEKLIHDAVQRRMLADVPVGAFLSGGTDSATIVAMMQLGATQKARTFTVGFQDGVYDETAAAREVARHLGTDHCEIRLDEGTALNLVPEIAGWFDEPFADSSQLPTYLVSRATRQHVTVALSGDGGDEVFGGYPKYNWLDSTWKRSRAVPAALRSIAGHSLQAMPENAYRKLASLLLESGSSERIGERARRLGAALSAPSVDAAIAAMNVVGIADQGIVPGAKAIAPILPDGIGDLDDITARMRATDFAGYLPDDILTKVDRCSMAVSLEAREPLLDHRLVEFVWSLPPEIQRGHEPKALLKSVLRRHVPPALVDRPKRGFSVPLAQWLRGPLRGWADDLLSPTALAKNEFLDKERVGRLWRRHLSGAESNPTGLWNMLMFSAWSERWLKR